MIELLSARWCVRFFRNSFILVSILFTHPVIAQETELTFGLYTADKPSEMVKTYRPILSAIEKNLAIELEHPVKIKMQIARSYEEGVDALVQGDVDFSQFGPAPYIEAFDLNPGLRILALDSKDGSKRFHGVITVTEDSPISTVSDLQGTKFAFGNEGSTIGRYLSQAYLVQHGVTASNLASYDYLVRHDRVGHAVAQGTHDAGALKEGTFNKLVKKGLPLRALARFYNVNKPWITRSGFDENLFQSLQKVMFELDAPAAFKAFGRSMFVAGTDADFEDIRKSIKNNGDFFDEPVNIGAAMDAK